MPQIYGSRIRTNSLMNKNKNLYPKCELKLKYPPVVTEEEANAAAKEQAKKILAALRPVARKEYQNPCSKGRLKFQCHYEERKRKAESRRRKVLQKLKNVYRINTEDLNENVTNEIIMQVELIEKRKRERAERNLERTVIMVNRLLEDQKYKRRGFKVLVPPWRKAIKYAPTSQPDLICEEEEEVLEIESSKGDKSEHLIQKRKTKKKVGIQAEVLEAENEEKKSSSQLRSPTTEGKEEEGGLVEVSKCVEQNKTGDNLLLERTRPATKGMTDTPIENSLEANPKRVVFQDYKKGKVHLQEVKITNIGTETIHCRYLGISVHVKAEEKFPIGVAVRDSVKLRPGLSCSTKIRLYSEDDTKELECSVVYETRRQGKPLQHSLFIVPVVCLPARAVVKLTPLKIHFPSLTWCAATGADGAKQLRKTLRIENTGGKSCSCRIFKIEPPATCEGEEPEFCEAQEEEGETEIIPSNQGHVSSLQSTTQSEELLRNEFGESHYLSADAEAFNLLEELLENVFAAFRFSEKYHLEIPPFSVKLVEIRFIPHYKGFHQELHCVQLMDCFNLEEETIELTGEIKKLPIKTEPEVIDLKTCISNSGVYSSPFRIYNESKGPYSVCLKIPSSLRKHAHVYPRVTTIQPLTWFDFSLRIYPRVTLGRDSPRYFREDSKILEFPIFIHPANIGACKADYIKIYVFALITDYSLELLPAEVDLGVVTTLETVSTELRLTNHSLALQEFGFLNLPKGVRVEPNMGFGRILPKESIPLLLLYSPGTDEGEGIHKFNIRVTSVAEYGGFGEKLEPEEPFESIWGEGNYEHFSIPRVNSFCENYEESYPEEESEEYSSCEEASSIEGEELSRELRQRENKIREFLRQDIEDSSFNGLYPKSSDHEVPKSQASVGKNQKKSFSDVGETDESEGSLEGRPSRSEFQSVKCQAIVIVPRCQISESVIQLPATPCSSFSLYRFRLNGTNESVDADCVCGLRSKIKRSHLCKGKPNFEGCFEFQYFCPHIKLEPQSGYIKAGESLPITVIYRPEFPAEPQCHDSRSRRPRKFGGISASQPKTTGKPNADKSESIKGEDVNEIINASLYELEKYDVFAGERSLQELMHSFYVEAKIQCVIKTLECGEADTKTEVHELLLICPGVKPSFIYLGGSQNINFGKVFVGTRPKLVVQVQNISFDRISPTMSLLNPKGPFSCPAALRKVEVDPEHIWRQPLIFAPVEVTDAIDAEYFEIYCGSTNIFLTVSGEAIEPQYKITPNFACCVIRAKSDLPEEVKLEVENLSPITLKLQFKEEFTKEGTITDKEDGLEGKKEKTTEGGGSKEKKKTIQTGESKDKKRAKNTGTSSKNLNFLDEIPATLSDELEKCSVVLEKVFTVIGCEDGDQIAVAPQGRQAIKIRFTPPADKSVKDYAVKYKIMLEKLHPLKEILVIGTVSKGS